MPSEWEISWAEADDETINMDSPIFVSVVSFRALRIWDCLQNPLIWLYSLWSNTTHVHCLWDKEWLLFLLSSHIQCRHRWTKLHKNNWMAFCVFYTGSLHFTKISHSLNHLQRFARLDIFCFLKESDAWKQWTNHKCLFLQVWSWFHHLQTKCRERTSF